MKNEEARHTARLHQQVAHLLLCTQPVYLRQRITGVGAAACTLRSPACFVGTGRHGDAVDVEVDVHVRQVEMQPVAGCGGASARCMSAMLAQCEQCDRGGTETAAAAAAPLHPWSNCRWRWHSTQQPNARASASGLSATKDSEQMDSEAPTYTN
jgi:hypothetical protein